MKNNMNLPLDIIKLLAYEYLDGREALIFLRLSKDISDKLDRENRFLKKRIRLLKIRKIVMEVIRHDITDEEGSYKVRQIDMF